MPSPSFPGFTAESVQFFASLAANNNRDWFQDHKASFQTLVQMPAQAFVSALGTKLQTISPNIQYDTALNGSGSIMRIYRDVRFSQDKTPYKTHLGIVFWEGAGKKTENPAFYFGLDAQGGRIYAGMMGFPKALLNAYREAVIDETLGQELVDIVTTLRTTGNYEINGEHYKRVPRGFDKDHPRADLLRYNSLGVVSPQLDTATVTSPNLVDICFAHCQQMAPVQQWLVKVNTRL